MRRRGKRTEEGHFLSAEDERRVHVWLVGASGRCRRGGHGWVAGVRPSGNRGGRLVVGGVCGRLPVGHLLESVPRGPWESEPDALSFATKDAVVRGWDGTRGRVGGVRLPLTEAATGWWWAGGRDVSNRLGGGRSSGSSRGRKTGGAAAARRW